MKKLTKYVYTMWEKTTGFYFFFFPTAIFTLDWMLSSLKALVLWLHTESPATMPLLEAFAKVQCFHGNQGSINIVLEL